MLDPLRLARLAGDHGDGVGRGRRVLSGEDVVEDGEAAGVSPEEGDCVAVDMRHDEARELLAHRLAFGTAGARVAMPLDERKLIHLRNAVLHVELRRKASVRMIGRVLEGGVLLGSDAKRLNFDRLAGEIVGVDLRETRRVGGGTRIFSVGIEPVDARERSVFVVERPVLVEDHEDVLDPLPQRFDVLLGPFGAAPARIRFSDEIGRDLRARIWLRRRQRPGIGCGKGRLKETA
jgi:hypothetical protein